MCSFLSTFIKMQLHFLRHLVHKTVLGVSWTRVLVVSNRMQTLQLTPFLRCDICNGSVNHIMSHIYCLCQFFNLLVRSKRDWLNTVNQRREEG